MGINTAIEAEVAYRREQVAMHYRPWRRVGTERRSSRAGSDTARRAATSVVTVSR
ncbi:MAG TPA: hypothetical protein VFM01_12145 [Nakamurella sp.]|jgi:hypothetical protein|nr:hypothetical protein [Nakamurella sp.]